MPKCPKDCKKQNPLIFKKTVIPAIVGNDDVTPPENGAFCNMLVVYEATGNAYLYSSDGIPTLLSTTDYTRLNNLPTINGEIILGDLTLEDLGISQLVEAEAEDRREADTILQTQIDAITASSDVVDIVGTYEELEEYDTSVLTDNDIIKVISDETVGGATTYYRWENHEWVYIGAEGPYYTKNETDALLDQKLDIDALDDALEDYYDKTETDALLADKADAADLASKQDKLIAGDNIIIDQATNVISAIVPSLDNYYTKQETYSQSEVDDLISDVEDDIPTATSQLTNDSGFLTTVPIATDQLLGGVKVGSGLSITPDGTLSADAQHIDVDTALSTTSTNPVENRVITNALNNKANITDIPTVPTNISAFYNDAGYVTGTTLAQNYYNKTETYTKTEVDNFISGVSSNIPTKTSDLTNDGANGTSTYVERSALATVATTGSYNDLTNTPSIPPEMTILSYGNSTWQEFIDAYNTNTIVYCRASSNSNPATGAQNRLAFMAYVNNANNPSNVEFQYYRSVNIKSASQQCDQVYVYTLTPANGGTWTVTIRDANVEVVAGAGLTSVYSNGRLTLATTSAIPTKTSDLTNDSGFVTNTDYASANGAGVVKVGSGLSIDANGVLSSNGLTSVDWTDVTNKPTNVSYWTNDAGYITSAALPTKTSDLTNDGSDGTSTYVEADELATVATSGDYDDLINKPTIPAAQVNSDWNASSGVAQILNKPTLATVATSGSYNDLSNKPNIPTVNNATLTIQRNGANVQTFTANASSNVTANISVPTKTSDLTNDGSDNTSTYIETDDAQKFAIGQGSTNPVFDEMTPVKTIEWDVTDQTYRPIYQMANTGWTYINMDITVAYRITVTGTNIHSVTDIVDRWHNPVNYPITSMFCRTLGSSGATTGLRYLRAVYPVSAYLNNASYPLGTEIAMYNATARHVKIEVFKDNSQVTWNTTKPSGPIYVSGTYNNNNVMSAYDTRGWRFRQPAQMYASNAGYAEYISNFEPVNTAASELKNGATALAGGHYAFLADDGLVYDISNTAKNISMCESKVGFMNSTVAANAAISYTYWRAISRPNATQVGYISHDTFALGNRVFLRCTMDSSGNVHSDNYLSTTMSAGYTWMPFGWARSATTLYVDTRFPMFYTLDANGKLTHINGKEVAGSGAASVAWGDITGKPTFATVATSGSYNDLTNKPTIPTVNNATLTIQKNSTNVATFTANASSNVTANISVPTATSDLTNDSGFITSITKITNAEIDAIMGVA